MGNLVDSQQLWDFVATNGIALLISLATAIFAWIVGRWLIRIVIGLIGKMLDRSGKIDAMLARYIQSTVAVLLNVILVLAILDIFGVKTTSFAALLAGAGLAIGAAWSGMLGNFAAGLFMQLLRPYKVGDYIEAGGVEGTVDDLGILATTLITAAGIKVIVGNNKIFSDNIKNYSDNIKNYSARPLRAASCNPIVPNSVDPEQAIARLRPAVAAIANIAEGTTPAIDIVGFTPEGPKLAVAVQTSPKTYWQVYTDLHKVVLRTFREADYPAPERPVAYRLESGSKS